MFAFLFEMKWKHHKYDIFHIVYTETCIQLKDIKTARFLPIIKKAINLLSMYKYTSEINISIRFLCNL